MSQEQEIPIGLNPSITQKEAPIIDLEKMPKTRISLENLFPRGVKGIESGFKEQADIWSLIRKRLSYRYPDWISRALDEEEKAVANPLRELIDTITTDQNPSINNLIGTLRLYAGLEKKQYVRDTLKAQKEWIIQTTTGLLVLRKALIQKGINCLSVLMKDQTVRKISLEDPFFLYKVLRFTINSAVMKYSFLEKAIPQLLEIDPQCNTEAQITRHFSINHEINGEIEWFVLGFLTNLIKLGILEKERQDDKVIFRIKTVASESQETRS